MSLNQCYARNLQFSHEAEQPAKLDEMEKANGQHNQPHEIESNQSACNRKQKWKRDESDEQLTKLDEMERDEIELNQSSHNHKQKWKRDESDEIGEGSARKKEKTASDGNKR